MVTRCPSCDTLFRVTPQHLQAHHGQVRCGRCMAVFDGFRALATLPDQSALEPEPRRVAEEPAGARRGDGGEFAAAHAVAAPVPASETGPPEVAAEVAVPAHSESAPVASTSPEAATAIVAPPPAATMDAAQREAQAAGGGAAHEMVSQLPRRRLALAWSIGIGMLVLALGGQALYAFRVDLVANFPGLKPFVVQFCDLLGCSVPLPQRPGLIAIEASDLQVQDPARPGIIRLTATLRNHAGLAIGYPALDLVLTNTKEHMLARRIFMPGEYLDRERNASAGLAANAEVTVSLVLDTGDLGAAGFRLALLPAR